jgi:DNA-directed DNA polymerase III PolC
MAFVHLHVHSNYSLLQGVFSVQELIAAAVRLGMPAVALTDTNGLYGAMLFYEAAREAGVKPIIGTEIVYGREQCVLLAADRQGYANLCRIVTERKLWGTKHYEEFRPFGSPFDALHSLRARSGRPTPVSSTGVRVDGTNCSVPQAPARPTGRGPKPQACPSFDIAASIAADARGLFVLSASPSLLRRLKGAVPEGRLYAELRADGPGSFETECPALRGPGAPEAPAEMHRQAADAARRSSSVGSVNICDAARCSSFGGSVDICDAAERLGIPLAATVNVNFLRPEPVPSAARLSSPTSVEGDRHTHAVLSAIRENVDLKGLCAQGRMMAGPHSFFMPAGQVAARLPPAVREEAIRNTLRIAEACNLELEMETPHFPKADLPQGETPQARLREVAYAGARRRYGRLRKEVKARLEKELAVIEKLGFCDYFLVVRDIVEFAEREDIPHVGRGSAANSIVSYCLGISAVDPLKFDLYFERFLNEFRTDVPDIDIDFCWRRRDDVIDYVYRRYGKGRVAMVSTHSTLRARSAFRDVARVMGLPLREIDSYSRKLPYYGASSIEEAMETFPEMADFPIAKEPWRTVVETALKVDGYVRHLSIHLGGLVIGDQPLTWYTALENSAKGIVVTQYEMKGIEKTGLVKMDLLGQRSLSIVAEAARRVEEARSVRVDLEKLPDRDPRTAALLRNGRTMGCFQIESPGMRQLLQMLQAGSIMDLIQGLSLIRPGPSSSGMKHAFICRMRRMHGMRGEEPVSYPTPLLEEALSKTYGVMLYQEDILRVAQSVAGFSLAEGDELRKYISKQRSREKLQQLKDRFVAGAVSRGVEPAVAEDIWRQIESFAAYSYCKAHACTYGHISYQAAYLKAHWPAEFLASVIANKAGFYDARTYIEEARRFNVRILAPCVNRSDIECRAEVADAPGRAGCIRPGLEFVRSLSSAAIKQILQQRTIRPFGSLEDFCARVTCGRAPLTREEMENLILCGAFDSFGLTRPTLMMKMERILRRERSSNGQLSVVSRQLSVTDRAADGCLRQTPGGQELSVVSDGQAPTVHVPEQPEYPLREQVLWELKILGFSHSGHPLDAWDGELSKVRSTPSYEMKRHVGRKVAFVGWLVTTRRAVTRTHEYMEFMTLEDRHGVLEAVLFPDVYRRFGRGVGEAGCYRVSGTVKEQFGSVALVADEVELLSPP